MEYVDKGAIVNFQPLIDRLAELADLGTLILLFTIAVLLGLLISERARSNTLANNYMKQSVEVVKVLTSLKSLIDSNLSMLQSNEIAISAVSNRLFEIQHTLENSRVSAAPRKRKIKSAIEGGTDELAP